MIAATSTPLAALYESDETAWLDEMAEIIRSGRTDELDYEHLAEFLTDMALRDRREVTSRLRVLLAHILKWIYQPAHRSGGWKATIFVLQQALRGDVEAGVLRNHAISALPLAYEDALDLAAAETGLDRETLPAECPWTIDDIVDRSFIDRIS